MRILELEIENFGVFQNRRLSFNRGLQVIYGPNEAGKSTLLQLVRELLFGFPHRNAYSLADHAGPLAAKASLEMQDGQQLWFRRRKGRPDKISGELENERELVAVDDRMLTAMLGNATAELYDNIFGFSLDELAQGTASLQQANVNDALYGTGVGNIANVQQVRSDLESDAKRLFNTRSRKSQIMQLLDQLRDDEDSWRSSMVTPSRHREMVAEQVNADQEADQLKKRLDAQRAATRRRGALLEALPLFDEWRLLKKQLEQLPPLDGDWDAEAPQRFERLNRRLDELVKERDQFAADAEKKRTELAKLPPDGTFTQHASAINELHQQVGRLRADREQLPRRRAEAESLRDSVARELQRIRPDLSGECLNELHVDAEHQHQLRRMSEQKGKLDRRRTELRSQLKMLRTQAKRWRELLNLPTDRIQRLRQAEQLVERLLVYRTDCEQLEDLQSRRQRVDAERERLSEWLQRQTPSWSGDSLPASPPAREAIEQAAETLKKAEQSLHEWQRRSERDLAERATLEKQLNAFDQSEPVSPVDLQAARENRDEAWSLLQQVEQDHDPEARRTLERLAGNQSPWDWMRNRMELVDQCTDRLLKAADRVAERNQLQQRLTDLKLSFAELTVSLEESQQAFQQAAKAWEELWRGCGIEPLAPTEMAAWRDRYLRWVEVRDEGQRLETQLNQKRAATVGYETQWQTLISQLEQQGELSAPTSDPSTDASDDRRNPAEPSRLPMSIARGVAWFEREGRLLPELEVAKREAEPIEQRLAEQTDAIESLDKEEQQWTEDWGKLLGHLRFPQHWEPHLVEQLFQVQADASNRLREAASLDKQADEIQSRLEDAANQVAELCEQLECDSPADTPVDITIQSLHATLQDERNGQQRKRRWQLELEEAERRVAQRNEEVDEIRAKLQTLQRSLAVDDPAEMKRRVETHEQREKLRKRCQQLESQLTAYAAQSGVDDASEFHDRLESADAESLQGEAENDRLQTRELEDKLEQAHRRAGAAADALERLSEATDANRSARELASDHARLGQLVDRYAPLAMATQLLAMSMEQFERVNQPSLLRETSRLYAQLTEGRYQRVIRKLDDKQSLSVEDRHGRWKTSRELSTGAREQLYLAIRLAYVAEYCRRAEPLPIVMDDVLVNFDDSRAAAALQTLAEFAEGQQVLFLSCHQRIVDLADRLSIPTSTLPVREQPLPVKPKRKRRAKATGVTADSKPEPIPEPDGPRQRDLF